MFTVAAIYITASNKMPDTGQWSLIGRRAHQRYSCIPLQCLSLLIFVLRFVMLALTLWQFGAGRMYIIAFVSCLIVTLTSVLATAISLLKTGPFCLSPFPCSPWRGNPDKG
jgi:drug/metabolite transporter (DMT)-like permease